MNFVLRATGHNPPTISICPKFQCGIFYPPTWGPLPSTIKWTSKCSVAFNMQHPTKSLVMALLVSIAAALVKNHSGTRPRTTFVLQKPTLTELGSAAVERALKEDGLIAVEVPGFDALNRAVLRAAHECIDSTKTPQATLADGTVRRSLATSRSNNEAGPLEVTCAPLAVAQAEFRETVWSVAQAVAARLSAIDEVEAAAPLLKTRDGAPYATVSDIVRAGDHLEHFHSCRAVRKSNPRPRRDVYYTGIARKARPRKPR